MSQPVLSVCVVAYNHGKFIRECLDGILMQRTNFEFEIVVGEDCSPDDTRAIIKEYEEKYPGIIIPIYQDKNVGMNRNYFEYVFPKMRGKYIAWCDGDDYWTNPEKLQKQVEYLEAHPECAITFHSIDTVDQNKTLLESQQELENVKTYPALQLFSLPMPTVSIVFRNVFHKFMPELMLTKSPDAIVKGYLSRFGGAANLGFKGACYRQHMNGVASMIPKVLLYQRAIQCRQIMMKTSLFTSEQKNALKRDIARRKKLYTKIFIKKGELLNAIKVYFTRQTLLT